MVQNRNLQHRERLKLLHVASNDLYFMPHEAHSILRTNLLANAGSVERIKAVMRLLFRLMDPAAAPLLIERNLNRQERKVLQARLGQAYRLVLGNPTGHYKLDMSLPLDRFAAAYVVLFTIASRSHLAVAWCFPLVLCQRGS